MESYWENLVFQGEEGQVGQTSVCQALVLYQLHLKLQLKGNEIKTLTVINKITFVIFLGAAKKEVH